MLSLKVGFMAFSISYFLAEVQLTGIPAFPAPGVTMGCGASSLGSHQLLGNLP